VELLEIKKQLNDLLARRYVRPRKSPYGALVLSMDKKDGKLQMPINPLCPKEPECGRFALIFLENFIL
jgi:hypothetical protein